jgi:hypothetical protein
MSLTDLDDALEEAVCAYRSLKMLRTLRRISRADYTVRNLAEDYPHHYLLLDTDDKIRFIGKSAGEILEDYLAELGYSRGSDLWFALAHIVIERGEHLYDDESETQDGEASQENA